MIESWRRGGHRRPPIRFFGLRLLNTIVYFSQQLIDVLDVISNLQEIGFDCQMSRESIFDGKNFAKKSLASGIDVFEHGLMTETF